MKEIYKYCFIDFFTPSREIRSIEGLVCIINTNERDIKCNLITRYWNFKYFNIVIININRFAYRYEMREAINKYMKYIMEKNIKTFCMNII